MGGLFYHSGSGKADHALGLGNDDVAQRSEACCNSAGGGMGEDRNIGAPGLSVSSQRSAGLGHLHETENALMHAGTARSGKDNDGLPLGGGKLDGSGDFFSHDTAHAGSEETEVHDGENHRDAFDVCPTGNDCLHEASLGLVGFHFIEVAFKSEGIHGIENTINLGKTSFIDDGADPIIRVQREVVSTLGADAKIADECFFEKGLATGGALDPQPLGHVLLFLAQIGDSPFLENSHVGSWCFDVAQGRQSVNRRWHFLGVATLGSPAIKLPNGDSARSDPVARRGRESNREPR